MKYITLASLAGFFIYALTSIGLLSLFTALYHYLTPYHEMTEMRKGNQAPSIAMGGAMLGYTVSIIVMSFVGINYADFLIWAGVAGVFQLALFKILYKLIPMNIEEDNCAIAIFYAVSALCLGLITAFSLIPQ
jgi:putative membrane protein